MCEQGHGVDKALCEAANLLTPEESVLVLIDHQAFQFTKLRSHEPTMIVNNVIALLRPPRSSAFGFLRLPRSLRRNFTSTNPRIGKQDRATKPATVTCSYELPALRQAFLELGG